MNYEDEEIQLIGIMSEQSMIDRKEPIFQQELDKAIKNALGIGPMMDPLIQDLKEKDQYDDRTKEIEI